MTRIREEEEDHERRMLRLRVIRGHSTLANGHPRISET